MQVRNPLAHLPTLKRRRARLALSALAVTAATLGGGLLATALPAYADVTTNAYTIGAPSGAVGAVTASPSAVGEGTLRISRSLLKCRPHYQDQAATQ